MKLILDLQDDKTRAEIIKAYVEKYFPGKKIKSAISTWRGEDEDRSFIRFNLEVEEHED